MDFYLKVKSSSFYFCMSSLEGHVIKWFPFSVSIFHLTIEHSCKMVLSRIANYFLYYKRTVQKTNHILHRELNYKRLFHSGLFSTWLLLSYSWLPDVLYLTLLTVEYYSFSQLILLSVCNLL